MLRSFNRSIAFSVDGYPVTISFPWASSLEQSRNEVAPALRPYFPFVYFPIVPSCATLNFSPVLESISQ